MASRTTESPDGEFDLTRFLWGDLPLLGEQPDTAGADPPISVSTDLSAAEDRLVAETPSIRETTPTWEGAPHHRQHPASPTTASDSDETLDDEEDLDAEADIDLEVLADLAELATAEFGDDDPASEAVDDEFDEFVLDERALSYGELTQRLHKEILPRLRSLAESKGYLTLGHLARAVLELQASDIHLDEVHDFVERGLMPVLPSRARPGIRHLPLWASRHAQQRFGDLLRDQIDEHVVIKQFGYTGVPLSPCTRAFLVQAWMCHGLSRTEEGALVSSVNAEVTRVGDDPRDWSAEAWAAREELILDNLSMVARMARHYIGHGVAIDDLLQFGALGLFRAVERYDPERVDRFVKYASRWVFQSITRHIADHARLIRLPVYIHDRGAAIAEARSQLRRTHNREPTLAEVAEASATSENVVRAILITTRPVSLDDPLGQVTVTLLADPADLAEQAEANAMADSLKAVLATLSARERDVIEQRFGLIDGEVRTLEELGQAYGVTRERIRQIESKAIRLLQLPSRINLLREDAPPPSPTPVLNVPAAAAKTLLPALSEGDQEIVRRLWGLDRRRQLSVQSAAERLCLPTRHVRNVSFQVAALHRAQNATPVVRRIAVKRRSRQRCADSQEQSALALGIHPGWKLSATDKTSADWAARLFGVPAPFSSPPESRHVVR